MPRTSAASATDTKKLMRHPKCSAFFLTSAKRSSESRLSTTGIAPPSVAYLANMTIDVTSKALKGGPQYAITVHDRKSSSTWRYLRSYDQCRGFQLRLLDVMERGHLCFAECPWLYTFIKRIFPQPKLFRYTTPKVVESRRLALSRFFLTLQAVLVNPINHSCNVLSSAVANEVVGFLTNHGDSEPLAPWQQLSPAAIRPLARTFSESFMSTTDDLDGKSYTDSPLGSMLEDDLTHLPTSEERFCCAMCALHASSSDEQIFASWQATSLFPSALRGATSTVPRAARASAPPNMLSPLSETAILGSRGSDVAVLQHEGTPKEPYPADADYRMSLASPSGSSIYEDVVVIDVSLTGVDKKSESIRPSDETTESKGLKPKLTVLPLRALQQVTHALRHKLSSPSTSYVA